MRFFITADIIGITVFTVLGFLVSGRMRLDFFGALIVCFLTGLGGGIIRDLVVRQPIFAFSHFYPGVVVLLTFLFCILFRVHRYREMERHYLLLILDAVGLAAFSIAGSQAGLLAGLNLTGVLFAGFITSAGGGMIRDALLNRIPDIFIRDFWGSVSILISFSLFLLDAHGLLSGKTILLTGIGGFILRMIASLKQWHLPRLNPGDGEDES